MCVLIKAWLTPDNPEPPPTYVTVQASHVSIALTW